MDEIGSSFQESATQSAFVTLAAHHSSLKSTQWLHSQKLDVLTQCTKPLSPSCQREKLPTDTPAHFQARTASTPQGHSQCRNACSLCAPPNPVQATHILEDPPAPPWPPLAPILQASAPAEAVHMVTLPTHTVNEAVHISGPIPTTSGSETLTLVPMVHGGKTHMVLQLLPGPSPPYTAFDMIFSEPAAFCDLVDMTADQYPTFTSQNCNWNLIVTMIILECQAPMAGLGQVHPH